MTESVAVRFRRQPVAAADRLQAFVPGGDVVAPRASALRTGGDGETGRERMYVREPGTLLHGRPHVRKRLRCPASPHEPACVIEMSVGVGIQRERAAEVTLGRGLVAKLALDDAAIDLEQPVIRREHRGRSKSSCAPA